MKRQKSIKQRYTPDEVEKAIVDSHGITRRICATLDCSIGQLNVWFQLHPEQAQLAEDCRKEIVSLAEDQLRAMLDDALPPATRLDALKFILKQSSWAKEWRGDQKSQEITVKPGEINIKTIFGIEDK